VWFVPATPSHLPILRIWRDEDPEFERRLTGFYAENDGWVREVAERGPRSGPRSGWIAFLGGEPAGLADLDVNEDQKLGHIAFYVAPAFRRRGVGTKIVRLVAKEARRMDLADLLATVERGNEASVRCLARAAFERVGKSSEGSSRFALQLRPSLPGPTIGQNAPDI
jgi:RimJ/RimL family protein N-acetyltransferase